jgi:hypothetical protein
MIHDWMYFAAQNTQRVNPENPQILIDGMMRLSTVLYA